MAFGWVWPDLGDDGLVIGLINWFVFVFRTFSLHIGVGLVVLGVAALLVRARWAGLGLMAAGIASIWPTARLYLPAEKAAVDPAGALTVMTVNAMYGSADGPELLAEIDRLKPDVLVIEEYTFDMEARVGAALLERLPHRAVDPSEDGAFGMAVYSSREFVGEPVLLPDVSMQGGVMERPKHGQIRVVVNVVGKEVVVQGVHTHPPLGISTLREQRRLARGLAEWAKGETRPIVMAGDFNFTVEGQSAGWLRRAGMVNTQTRWGRGREPSWPDVRQKGWYWKLPGVRIDHVWVKGLVSEAPEVGASVGSDHRPVVARVGFGK